MSKRHKHEPMHVLVADDRASDRVLLAAYAESFGWSAELVSNGRAAVSSAMGESYDLLVFDQHMPQLTGVEAIRTIRETPGPNRSTPALIWTASDPRSVEPLLNDIETIGLVGKPLTRSAFEAWAWRVRRDAPLGLDCVRR